MRRILTATVLIVLMSVSSCGNDDAPSAPAEAPATASPVVDPTTAVPASTVPTMPSATTEPAVPKLGQTQTTDLGTATVYAVKFPVKAQDSVARDIQDEGTQFAVADIKVCANGEVDADGYGFDASDFVLVDAEAHTYEFWNVQVGARSPNLTGAVGFGTDKPRKGSCKRGWLTFEVSPKTKIVSVEYNSEGEPLVWKVA